MSACKPPEEASMRTIGDYAMGINFACHVGQIRQSAKRCSGYTLVHGNRGRTSDDLCAWNGSDP